MKVQLTPEQQCRADKLARMTPREWDAICKRCGICCLTKIGVCLVDDMSGLIADRETAYLKQCCDKFDPIGHRCTVYQSRVDGRRNCEKVTMDIILDGELLPASCGYVEYIFGPARHPARVDFNLVRPIADGEFEKMSQDEIQQDIIPESILWNKRIR
ncbi:hypothetical protein HDR61_00970 [bacterium]|nr:hypothetical protein [bacterium]